MLSKITSNNNDDMYSALLINHYENECVQNFVDHVTPFDHYISDGDEELSQSGQGITKQYLSGAQQLKNIPLVKVKQMSLPEKKRWLEHKCDERRISYVQDSLTLVIERKQILRDSYFQWLTTDGFQFNKEIKIYFVGENAQDAGGLMREWITELTTKIFSKETNLFQMEADNSYFPSVYEAQKAYPNKEHLQYYKFAGCILAKAIFDKIPISPQLHLSLLLSLLMSPNDQDKTLLKNLTYSEMKSMDPQLHNSLVYLAEDPSLTLGQFSELLCELQLPPTMSKDQTYTLRNRKTIVNQLARWYLFECAKEEIQAFTRGFHSVIPHQTIKVFTRGELSLIIGGQLVINVADWKANTEYRGGYSADDKIIQWFWQVVEGFNQEQLRRLLVFSTGMPRVPIEGFRALQGNRNQIRLFQLEKSAEDAEAIKAHTCFNRMDLPPNFATIDDLRNQLLAIVSLGDMRFDFE